MHQRIEAGTDVAMIGAWDAARGAMPFSAEQQRKYRKFLEREAADGHVFLIHTGGDGGGAVDVYVDEHFPVDSPGAAKTKRLDGEFLVAVPSGRLIVAGAEDYRTDSGGAAGGEASIINVPAGDYALRCYVNDDSEDSGGKFDAIAQAEAAVLTPEERAYYHKVNYAELALIGVGWLLFLAFLPLARWWGWKIALPVTLAVAIPYFHWLDRRSRRRVKADVRGQEIRQKLSNAWLGDAPRTFALELRRVESRDDLKGGSVSVA